ncbi:NADH-quinone oxidoreductase subunit NuoG [Candidatus Desantisbacteria bacterium]|nr:NADH-quinone oxidoreductase subunit NuoG [Candidatus Desantisbacteria bacterium]
MVTLLIDGKQITVEKGTMILEAAEKAGVKIPALCADKRLIGFGACRMCVVQLKGRKSLIPACFNPVKDGMEVITNSPEIVESRRAQLQLILAEHPLDCPVCDKAGECQLQDLVYEYGICDNPYRMDSVKKAVERLSPLIERDMNRCILCGKCVRICNEVQGVGEISFINRGIKAYIGTDFDRPMECEFCGQCISVCPVGALNSKMFKYKTRVWDMKNEATLCPYCSNGCSLVLGIKDNEIMRVTGDYDAGINEGNLCSKGRFGYEFVGSPKRLKKPLVKKDGRFEETTWDEALSIVAAKFNEIKAASGADSIGGLGSARLTNEELYLFQLLIRQGIGTNNIDHGGRYQGLLGLKKSLGIACSTNSLHEIRKTNAILLVRANLNETHPNVRIEVNLAVNRNRASLIVADNKRTLLSRQAQANLICKPGTEVALINGIINKIVKFELADKTFVNNKTEGLEALQASIEKYTPEYVAEICGINPLELELAARTYARAKKACIIVATGMGLVGNDRDIARTASNLALLTGNVGKESCGVYILPEKNNSQGALDMGAVPGFLPGYVPVNKPGLEAIEMLEHGKLKAMYIVGENPVLTYPSSKVKEALEAMEFLVVQDMFMTPTAELADVVLPACSFAEKEGTYTNLERRTQGLKKILPCVGESRTDLEIFVELCTQLGCDVSADVWQEIKASIQSPLSASHFPPDTWKGKFIPVECEGIEVTDGKLLLVSAPSHLYSGTLSAQSPYLLGIGEACVELCVNDASRLGLGDGDMVVVSSKNAELKLKARISHDVPDGVGVVHTYPTINVMCLFGKEMMPIIGSVERVI